MPRSWVNRTGAVFAALMTLSLPPHSFARRRGESLTALPDRFLLHQGAIWTDTLVIFCSTIAVLTATA